MIDLLRLVQIQIDVIIGLRVESEAKEAIWV